MTQNMIRNFVLNLAILSLLVLNITPMAYAMDENSSDFNHSKERNHSKNSSTKNNSDRLPTSALLETLEKVAEDEKNMSSDFKGYALNANRYGYALKDQFAIPNERGYLQDEPPIS
ncbi:MAG: hypothetical protein P8H03_01695 [Emcibacteraceae bacterium]|nr:hypothetical protein [Emcibacteraceae bacterium]